MALKRAARDGMVDAFVPKAVSRLHFQYAPRNFILDNTASRASCHNASSVCFIDSPTCRLCVGLKACAHHRNHSLTYDARNKFQNNSNNHCDKCQRRTILFTTRALAHLPTLVTRWRITTAHLMLVTMRRRSKLRLDWCRCLYCQTKMINIAAFAPDFTDASARAVESPRGKRTRVLSMRRLRRQPSKVVGQVPRLRNMGFATAIC